MAGRPQALALALALMLALPLAPQEMGEFRHEAPEGGEPRFTQVLRWEAEQNARFYEVEVIASSGEPVVRERVGEAYAELSLAPGEYLYRVTLFNMLGKPELSTPWRRITVLKAELPRAASCSPSQWFLEDLVPELSIEAEGVAPGAEIRLEPADPAGRAIMGKELGRDGGSAIRVVFPADAVLSGSYSLVIVNPGGLSASLPSALAVKYQKEFDFIVSAGYAPWISLYDGWFLEAWPGGFFPLGAKGGLALYFYKRPFGYLGAELSAEWLSMAGGTSNAFIAASIASVGASALYKYPFSRSFAAVCRVGAGVAFSRYAISYASSPGASVASADLFLSAGASAQFYPTKLLLIDIGVEWRHCFMNGFAAGGIMPSLSLGLQF